MGGQVQAIARELPDITGMSMFVRSGKSALFLCFSAFSGSPR
jgi:hypothetical protein